MHGSQQVPEGRQQHFQETMDQSKQRNMRLERKIKDAVPVELNYDIDEDHLWQCDDLLSPHTTLSVSSSESHQSLSNYVFF